MKTHRVALFSCALLGGASILLACRSVLDLQPLEPAPDAQASIGDGGGPLRDGEARDGTAPDGATCGADLASDPKHCGRCDHDCLGGACTSGVCGPVKIADGLAVPEGLAVDATHVFVAEWDGNRIVELAKDGTGPCAGVPLPASCVFTADPANVRRPTAMGTDGQSVFWANTGAGTDHEIRSCPTAGCGAQAAKLVAQLGIEALGHVFGDDVLPLELVIRDGQVFWPESSGGAIRSAPVGGGAMTTYLENGKFMPLAIAVDDQKIYFTDDSNQHPTRIQAVPRDGSAKDGAAVETIADTPARPYGIALGGANVYWSVPFVSGDDGVVQAAPKSGAGGAAIGAVASNQLDPRALVVDARNIYWVLTGSATAATGMVVYCPLSGCPNDGPVVLASQQRVPRHLAQDDRAIYWSNEGLTNAGSADGQVWKIAKP